MSSRSICSAVGKGVVITADTSAHRHHCELKTRTRRNQNEKTKPPCTTHWPKWTRR
jgi:hypothetical protein